MHAGLRRTVVARGLGHRRTATDGPPCPQIAPWQRPAPLPYSTAAELLDPAYRLPYACRGLGCGIPD